MSDKSTRTVLKIFSAWNDAKEEAWLRKQALRGWHLESVGPIIYRFRRGEPADVTYRLDFQAGGGTFDRSEYLALFRDSGWEMTCRFGSWYYFRTPTGTGRVPEIHTDAVSKAAKYSRLLTLLILISALLTYSLLGPLNKPVDQGLWIGFRVLRALILALLAYGIIRLSLLVAKLKRGRA